MLKRLGLTFALILGFAGGLRAEVKIEHIQAANGPYWPSISNAVYHPGDIVSFRYLVTGMKLDSKKMIDGSVSYTVTDSKGKKVEGKSQPWTYAPALGKGTAPHMTAFDVTDTYQPGEYKVHVEVKDHISEEKVSFDRMVTIRPSEWAISAVAFFHDPEGRHPACLDAHVGEQIYYKMKIVGYDKTRIDAELEMEMLDKDGKDIGIKPFTQVFINNNTKLIESVPFLMAEGALPSFSRPGEFKLKITMIDHVNEKTAVYEAPVRVSYVP